jgi:hypothetical protein
VIDERHWRSPFCHGPAGAPARYESAGGGLS